MGGVFELVRMAHGRQNVNSHNIRPLLFVPVPGGLEDSNKRTVILDDVLVICLVCLLYFQLPEKAEGNDVHFREVVADIFQKVPRIVKINLVLLGEKMLVFVDSDHLF